MILVSYNLKLLNLVTKLFLMTGVRSLLAGRANGELKRCTSCSAAGILLWAMILDQSQRQLKSSFGDWQSFTAALLPLLFGNRIPSHTTREPPVGFELATNCIQFYVIANLDKRSLNFVTLKRQAHTANLMIQKLTKSWVATDERHSAALLQFPACDGCLKSKLQKIHAIEKNVGQMCFKFSHISSFPFQHNKQITWN